MRISDWSSDVCSSDLAEPRHDVAARPDVEHRQPLGLLHTDVDSALRPAQDRGDLVRSVVHGIEIVTEDLDRAVATYPGDQLVEPHLDRLGDLERPARTTFEDRLKLCYQFRLWQAPVGPFAFRLPDDEGVGDGGRSHERRVGKASVSKC